MCNHSDRFNTLLSFPLQGRVAQRETYNKQPAKVKGTWGIRSDVYADLFFLVRATWRERDAPNVIHHPSLLGPQLPESA